MILDDGTASPTVRSGERVAQGASRRIRLVGGTGHAVPPPVLPEGWPNPLKEGFGGALMSSDPMSLDIAYAAYAKTRDDLEVLQRQRRKDARRDRRAIEGSTAILAVIVVCVLMLWDAAAVLASVRAHPLASTPDLRPFARLLIDGLGLEAGVYVLAAGVMALAFVGAWFATGARSRAAAQAGSGALIAALLVALAAFSWDVLNVF